MAVGFIVLLANSALSQAVYFYGSDTLNAACVLGFSIADVEAATFHRRS